MERMATKSLLKDNITSVNRVVSVELLGLLTNAINTIFHTTRVAYFNIIEI